jgi:hypothetical protein
MRSRNKAKDNNRRNRARSRTKEPSSIILGRDKDKALCQVRSQTDIPSPLTVASVDHGQAAQVAQDQSGDSGNSEMFSQAMALLAGVSYA